VAPGRYWTWYADLEWALFLGVAGAVDCRFSNFKSAGTVTSPNSLRLRVALAGFIPNKVMLRKPWAENQCRPPDAVSTTSRSN
jgi:hypothetical protein